MRLPPPAALGFLLLLLSLLPAAKVTKKLTPCARCQELVDKFNQGMVDTAKKNFGGGNTAWEEKSLSKYEFSEVRLVEILEGLCDSSNFECNQMLEEQEGHLEAWWLHLQKQSPDLFQWFCVETLKVCCPAGTYGPDCLACPGGAERPCSGNGHCSGDGSRQGDGSCQCYMGYRGALCRDCMDGYFSAARNDTHSVCTVCNEACKTCTGPSSGDCAECEVGWARKQDTCVDINECEEEASPCSESQYCKNVPGSYTCEECDSTCVGCTGEGPGRCVACVPGYTKDETGQCSDIDECSQTEKPCARENENCYNTPGSFVCVCPDGYKETDAACVLTAEGGECPGRAAGPGCAPCVQDIRPISSLEPGVPMSLLQAVRLAGPLGGDNSTRAGDRQPGGPSGQLPPFTGSTNAGLRSQTPSPEAQGEGEDSVERGRRTGREWAFALVSKLSLQRSGHQPAVPENGEACSAAGGENSGPCAATGCRECRRASPGRLGPPEASTDPVWSRDRGPGEHVALHGQGGRPQHALQRAEEGCEGALLL
ncbi:protein disulfide isomerase CRELD2 [Orycteropus afer afer]|uniref:Protein disulfide isomerase CRELD2 n=1 Tax=Orycteropus afer afer TaxID=1230840 RepID=A0AC54ZAR2_ORYAF|nr:protein disulfide isomerase CRELD2 [Orycteropus afer afer]